MATKTDTPPRPAHAAQPARPDRYGTAVLDGQWNPAIAELQRLQHRTDANAGHDPSDTPTDLALIDCTGVIWALEGR